MNRKEVNPQGIRSSDGQSMKKQIYILCCLLCLFLLSGCQKKTADEGTGDYIYYTNTKGTALVKEQYQIEQGDAGQAVSDMLEALAEAPESIDYQSSFPIDLEVIGFTLEDQQLYLNYNEAYHKMDPVTEVLLRAAVVQSLVQIDGVEYVAFAVEGEPLTSTKGGPVGLMQAEDFVQNTGSAWNSYQTVNLTLYFANKAGDHLVKETGDVKYSSNNSIEKVIVEQLMKGPQGEHAQPTIPPEAKLLGVSVKDGICYVNFDEGFLRSSYDVTPNITIYSIANSIIDSGSVSQVQISINGETNVSYKESIKLDQPFERDLDIVEEIETIEE